MKILCIMSLSILTIWVILIIIITHKSVKITRTTILPKDKKYITFTLTSDNIKTLGKIAKNNKYFGCAGMIHCRMCLANLIILARKTKRIAILMPPWLYLNKTHNNERELPINIGWDRYFDLSEYINEGVLELNPRTQHTPTPRGAVTDGIYIEPDTSYKKILKMSDKLIVLQFYNGWGKTKSGGTWECGGTQIGGGIGHGWQRILPDWKFKPSSLVKEYAKKIAKDLGKEFIIIHVRRGDIVGFGNYWNLTKQDIDLITSSDYIIKFLKNKVKVPVNNPIFIMTNEPNLSHFDKLKKVYKKVTFEKDIASLTEIQSTLKDNFLVYEICRYLGSLARIRISTLPCYFYNENCQYTLADDLKGKK